MVPLQFPVPRNTLLRHLTPDDAAALQPHLRPVATTLRQVLIAPNEPVRQVYFPLTGFVSVVTAGRVQAEVGLIGPEGVVGAAPVLLGAESTPCLHFVQGPGAFLAVDAAVLSEAASRRPRLQRLLLSYIEVQLVQAAQTALVNAGYQIEARLARWLLMCHDRSEGDEFPITHEFLALMLGVQRTSITLALQALEGERLIRARRGRIAILARDALEAAAAGTYGVPEAEYRRLFGEA
ncbi:Crp/Fnr family transcriptional regulator [Methylobacterium sp. JK268]